MYPTTVIGRLPLLLQMMLLMFVESLTLPLWKNQLVHFQKWKGHFLYQQTSYACSMMVHSVHEHPTVSLTSEGILDVDMIDEMCSSSEVRKWLAMNWKITIKEGHRSSTAFSVDDIHIIFKQETLYKSENQLFEEFEFEVRVLPLGNLYMLLGNITRPTSNFSSIRLQPQSAGGINITKSSSLSVGLAVGISICLFIICIVIAVIILRWAIRKGYLRHVAQSYKRFRNPSTLVSFTNNQQTVHQAQVGIHM